MLGRGQVECFEIGRLDSAVIVSASLLVVLAGVSAWTWKHRIVRGGALYRITHVGLVLWLAAAVMQIAVTPLDCKMFWMSMTAPSVTVTTVAWTLFLMEFGPIRGLDSDRWRNPLLICLGAIMTIVAVTNSQHHALLGDGTKLAMIDGRPSLIIEGGPWYWALLSHNYAWVTVAALICVIGFLRTKATFRPLFGALILMTMGPVIGNIAYNTIGFTTFGVDSTPFFFVFTLAANGWLILNSHAMSVDMVGERYIFKESPAPILIADPGGHLVSSNPEAQAALTGPHGAQAQRAFADLLAAIARDGGIDAPAKVVIGDRVFRPQVLMIEDPVHHDRPSMGWTVTLFDVSREETITQSLREAKERAEEASRLQSEFLALVSHELRTPLTSIRGMLDMVHAGQFGDLPPASARPIAVARRNTHRLAALIDDLLDLQKLESCKLEISQEEVDLREVVRTCVEDLEGFGVRNGVALRLDCGSAPCILRTDVERLGQVITNVCSNAIKFSPDDGEVEVAVACLDDFVQICVSDSGEGIPAGSESKVFGRFSQIDGTTTRKHQGSGLGMNIARLIMEQLGGRIYYESEPNVGTTFFIELPQSATHETDVPMQTARTRAA